MNRPLCALAIAAAFTLALAACGHSSNVATQSAGSSGTAGSGPAVVKAGTVFNGKIQEEISSKSSPDGTKFQLVHVDSFMHNDPALKGATIDGHITGVSPAGVGKKPAMTIVFDDISMPDGTKAPIDVQLQSMGAFDAKSHHLRTLGMVIGGMAAGHLAAGKHHGGMLGAAGGYMLSQEMKSDIDVKPGTVLQVKFLSDADAASGAPNASATSGN